MMGSNAPPPKAPRLAALEFLAELVTIVREAPDIFNTRIEELKTYQASATKAAEELDIARAKHDEALKEATRMSTLITAQQNEVRTKTEENSSKETALLVKESALNTLEEELAREETRLIAQRQDIEKYVAAEKKKVAAEVAELRATVLEEIRKQKDIAQQEIAAAQKASSDEITRRDKESLARETRVADAEKSLREHAAQLRQDMEAMQRLIGANGSANSSEAHAP